MIERLRKARRLAKPSQLHNDRTGDGRRFLARPTRSTQSPAKPSIQGGRG